MKQTIFITGASTGLGKATALLFAKKGWQVIATMRNIQDSLDWADIENISVLTLDVSNPEQIISVSKEVIEKFGPIDVVFNNAGYGLAGPLEGIEDEKLVRQLDTNLLGVLRVTKAFIEHFRENKKGLFITTTSIGGHVAIPFNSVYHATKFALEGWSESMWYELKPFGIKIKTVAPGGILTDFAGRSLDKGSHPAYEKNLSSFIGILSSPERRKNYSTAEQIAEVVYEAATDGTDQLRYIAGNDAKSFYALRKQTSDEEYMESAEKRFFGESK
ncbi:SDR family oxidoreductase [Dyadobacter subterraneus]|uniref:SDR family oxidoreductase n=1 Tax=Dyadobacter subterraneus TaxID=2773304 RepID=A0ABR9WGJ1_9BACT|nr:SDR family oxidoreductase [Dyadobacter subterraneus]MBE9464041.1 SDR family oxidoreductase [Dyadobacter subterraneus]